MKFIDSNIIAYAFYENPHREECQSALKENGITDSLVLIEVFNILEHEVDRAYAGQVIRGLLRSHLDIVAVDANLLFEGLKRTSRFSKLSFLDLIHYTTAELRNCASIVTYDSDFNGLPIPLHTP